MVLPDAGHYNLRGLRLVRLDEHLAIICCEQLT
jgi:hypothetical protein